MNASRKFIIVSTTIGILLIILVSLSLAYAGRDNTLMKDKSLNLEINGFSLELPLAQNKAVYDPVCLSSISDNRIKLENDLGAVVTINGKTIKAGNTINLRLDTLTDQTYITIDVNNEKDHRVIYLRTISAQLPALTTVGKSLYQGHYYATLGDEKTGLYELNTVGDLVYYIAPSAVSPLDENYADFQKHVLDDGSVRYSYHRSLKGAGGLGQRILLDENHQYLKTITLKKSNDAKENEGLTIPTFILIDDDHWIVASKQLILAQNLQAHLESQTGGTKIQRLLIQEVVDSQVLYEFRSDRFSELYPLNPGVYTTNLNAGSDYTGFNGMILDPKDNHLILSFKEMDTLVKIDLENQKIIWKLSGLSDDFALLPDQKIIRPTSLSLSAQGQLIVFDQGGPGGEGRILTIGLDEVNKKIRSFDALSLEGSSGASGQKVGELLAIYLLACSQGGNQALREMNFTSDQILLEASLPEGYYFNRVKKENGK